MLTTLSWSRRVASWLAVCLVGRAFAVAMAVATAIAAAIGAGAVFVATPVHAAAQPSTLPAFHTQPGGAWLVTGKWPGVLPSGVEHLITADLDGDGSQEFLASGGQILTVIRASDGAKLASLEFDRPVTAVGAFDFDRDGVEEAVVGLADSGRQLVLKLRDGNLNVLDEKFLWATITTVQAVKVAGMSRLVTGNAIGQLFLWQSDDRTLLQAPTGKTETLAGQAVWVYPTGADGFLAFRSGSNRVGLVSIIAPPTGAAGGGSAQRPQPTPPPLVVAWSNYPWGSVTGVAVPSQRLLLAVTNKRLLYAYSLLDPEGSLSWQAEVPFFELSDLGWLRQDESSFVVGRTQDRVVAAALEARGVGPWWQGAPLPGLKGVLTSSESGAAWAWTESGDLWRLQYVDLRGWQGRAGPTSISFAVQNGSLMVAARELASTVGMELGWVGQNKKEVEISYGEHTLRAVPGAMVGELDGRKTALSPPLLISEGRLFLPVTLLEQWLEWGLELDRQQRIFHLDVRE